MLLSTDNNREHSVIDSLEEFQKCITKYKNKKIQYFLEFKTFQIINNEYKFKIKCSMICINNS
jgi:hypothetical protein